MALSRERKLEIEKGLRATLQKIETARAKSPSHQEVTLVAATKTRTPEEINYLASLGQKVIGENRVQELCEKFDALDPELEVHFIGNLQRNKVKYIIDKVSLIHSVDRLDLAQEIDRQAKKHGKVMDVLCEVNLGEVQKGGISPELLPNLLTEIQKLPNLRLCGLMAVAPISQNEQEQFENSQKFMKIVIDNSTQNIDNSSMQIASFGMSDDFCAAIAAGSNMVRIGSAIFGARNYSTSH